MYLRSTSVLSDVLSTLLLDGTSSMFESDISAIEVDKKIFFLFLIFVTKKSSIYK